MNSTPDKFNKYSPDPSASSKGSIKSPWKSLHSFVLILLSSLISAVLKIYLISPNVTW